MKELFFLVYTGLFPNLFYNKIIKKKIKYKKFIIISNTFQNGFGI